MNPLALIALLRRLFPRLGRDGRRERGAGTIEYVGMAAVCSVIIAGLVAVPWDTTINSGISSTLCKIFSKQAAAEPGDDVTVLAAEDIRAADAVEGVGTEPTADVRADCPFTSGGGDDDGGPESGGDEQPQAIAADAGANGGSGSGGSGSGSDGAGSGSGADGGSSDSDGADGDSSGTGSSDGEESASDSDDSERPDGIPANAQPTDHSVKGYDGPFWMDEEGWIYDGNGERIPNSKASERPSYGKDQVQDVWDLSREQMLEDMENGTLLNDHGDPPPDDDLADDEMWVEDKNGDWRKISWSEGESRAGVWDMGHLPGGEYRKLHEQYINGEITRDEFLEEYRDPENYKVEDPGRNRSHQDEED